MPKFYEQGIYPDNNSISNYSLFFDEDDPLSSVCKKWFDFIIDVCIFFWDIIANKIIFSELSDKKIVKVHGLFEIVNFINHQAI